MINALTIDELNKKLKETYSNDEKCIVGIFLARYDVTKIRKTIKESFLYWHHNTSKYINMYWAGYGEYLCPDEQSGTKIILDFDENTSRIYYDLEAFITIKNEFKQLLKRKYNDHFQLILANYSNGKLKFDESFVIDLEDNIFDPREIMEFITNKCHSCTDVTELLRKFYVSQFKELIKKIKVSDIINITFDMFNIAKK